ncbi:MAG: hypothetical protein QM581_03420, partial [Pseudomonas sp.]
TAPAARANPGAAPARTGPAKSESGSAAAPTPSGAQLQSIRERIEARRRQLREGQQNASGK